MSVFPENESSELALTLRPIGYIRTGKAVKFQAGHQPDERQDEDNVLELLPGHNYETALADLAGFDRIWLVWWFHRNEGWRPQVIPPRGPQRRRGVFATRSPHRPSPLGLTPVLLRGIEGRVLRLGPCDLVEGTPVFDIKPYVPTYDSFPEARAGWIDEVDALEAAPPAFRVVGSALALEQAGWLRAGWGIDFWPKLEAILGRDPTPHRTRRIRKTETGYAIGCGAWRALFTVSENMVTVTGLGPAYPLRFLQRENYEAVPDHDAQVAFLSRWPDSELPLRA
ncbi:MAG: tRNA (N6-threonylcarbamoyladenosine(37)-N6)-methyltransferase TrmO [Verrucomicrobia bacterium]|nr:tRNA (N6-threonylcarbamoyladenosine(37)-N6)-methyltransferase TrmO [Verrucomicrobiota bacterium]